MMALFALVPGLPFFPFISGATILGVCAVVVHRADKMRSQEKSRASQTQVQNAQKPASLGDMLDLDDVHVEFSPDLVSMVLDPATGLDARIVNMRSHVARTFGLIIPEIRLTDDPSLPPGAYVIRVHGVEQARDTLLPEHVLALIMDDASGVPSGADVSEPVYGAPARWIPAAQQEAAALNGTTIVSPTEVLATHLLEIVKQNFARLLTMTSLRRLLAELVNLSDTDRAEANRRLIAELVPDKVPVDMLLSVLRLLLDEAVSIRNLPLILEAIAEVRGTHPSPEAICEHVRLRLGFQLVAEMRRPDGTLPRGQGAPEWEEVVRTDQMENDRGAPDIALPPDDFNRLASGVSDKLARASETGAFPALITSAARRRFMRTVLRAKGVSNPVLSFDEVGMDARPAIVGLVPA